MAGRIDFKTTRGMTRWSTLLALLPAGCSAPNGVELHDREVPPPEVAGVAQPVLGEALDTSPTAWWWYYGQSATELTSLIDTNNGRLVSLQVESASPLRFTVAMVRAIAGIAEVPACSGAAIVSRNYFWGLFIHGGSSPGGTTRFGPRAPNRCESHCAPRCPPGQLARTDRHGADASAASARSLLPSPGLVSVNNAHCEVHGWRAIAQQPRFVGFRRW